MTESSPPPVRVQLVSTFYPHLGEHMGFRQARKHLDPALVQWREHLVTKDGEYLSLPFRAMRRLTRKWFSLPPRVYMLEDWLAEREMRRRAREGRFDILHYLDGEHSFWHGARWLSRLPRRPRVCALFHLPPERIEPLINRDEVRRLDAVLTLSPDQADWFKSWMDPARVHLLHHGIDQAFFHPADPAPPPEPPWRVLSVGSNMRDFDLLFRVANLLGDLPDVQFHVVKRFPPGTVIPSNVRVHTGLSDDDLAALYRRSHIAFMPLAKAVANNALQEGQASGLPTVVSDLLAVRYYSGPEDALYYPTGDADAAAAQIRRLLNDPDLRLRMGRAARRRAEQINWQTSAAELADVYQGLMRS